MIENKMGYRWDAELYAKHSGSQYAWALELIDKLRLQGHEHVLDIGCGDGKVTALIAQRLTTGSVLGIDSSPAMISLAERRHASGDRPPAFQLLDVRNLDEEERFDVAFSNAALHWVRWHPPVLQRVQKALARGGRIVFQMGGRGNAAHFVAVLDAMINSGAWNRYFADFDFPYGFHGPQEYTRWLVAADLTPVRVDLIEKDMQHAGKDGFAGWIRTTWLPYLERIPEALRTAFIDALTGEYLRRHPMDELGTVHVLMRRLEVEAVKD